jgi:hypothetical protein
MVQVLGISYDSKGVLLAFDVQSRRWGGIGGACEPNERLEQALARHCYSQVGVNLVAQDCQRRGTLSFSYHDDKSTKHAIEVYTIRLEGPPVKSAQVIPCHIPFSKIPYSKMHPTTAVCIENLLKENSFTGDALLISSTNPRILGTPDIYPGLLLPKSS